MVSKKELVYELETLNNRILHITKYIEGENFHKNSRHNRELLDSQLIVMKTYANILEKRILNLESE